MARKASFIATSAKPETAKPETAKPAAAQELSFNSARAAAKSFVSSKQQAAKLTASAASAADILLHEMVSGFLLSAKVTIGTPSESDFAEYDFMSLADSFEGRRKAQGAFKDSCLIWFGVNREHSNARSLWSELKAQAKVAIAARKAGMSAEIVDGKVKLSGGEGPVAEALSNADSSNKRKAVVAPSSGGKADRERDDKTDAGREATPSEVTSAAAAIARHVASGKVTACSATMSNLRAIAKLVAAHPELFTDD